MTKCYKVVFHYFNEDGNYIGKGGKQIAYFPKNYGKKSIFKNRGFDVVIDDISIVKM